MPWEGHLRSGPKSGMELSTRMLALYRTSLGCKRRRGAALSELQAEAALDEEKTNMGFNSLSPARFEVMEERKLSLLFTSTT